MALNVRTHAILMSLSLQLKIMVTYIIIVYNYKQIALFTVDEYSSSEGGRREGLSDSSNSASSDLLSLATPAEKYLHGLLMGRDHSRSNVTIKEVEGRGRSTFANKNFSAGDFVCEYSSNV